MTDEPVQTKRHIAALLGAAGLHPRKRFGQHFLIDGNLMRRLVASACVEADDHVLEVGGGTGGLTDLLIGRGARVVCVEIDRDMQTVLTDRFRGANRFTLVNGDVLASKHVLCDEVDALLGEPPVDGVRTWKLVANLPYQIATPLVMNLLVDYPQVRRLCFTVQAEVGERLSAKPGTKAFGPIGILTQALCRIESTTRIPPQAFWPAPSVDSVMLSLEVDKQPFATRDDLRSFARLVRGVFDHRRKTLRSALGYCVSNEQRECVCQQFEARRRPESFSVVEWLEIYRLASE